MTVILSKETPISGPTVQRYMREMGIAGVSPGPNLSQRNLEHKTYPYLLRGLKIQRPNQVWGIDITYIRLTGGWMYLVAVLDWYSRYVISWELDQTLEMPFVLRASIPLWRSLRLKSGIVTKAAILPARSTRRGCWSPTHASAWMAKAVPWTTFLTERYGEPQVRRGLPEGLRFSA